MRLVRKQRRYAGLLLLTAGVALSPLALADEAHLQGVSDDEGLAQVCFERPEDHGSLNMYRAQLLIDGEERASLGGGEAICFYLLPGETTLGVGPLRCDERYPFQIEAAKPVTLRLAPRRFRFLVAAERGGHGAGAWKLTRL